jgi:hypothetical protein
MVGLEENARDRAQSELIFFIILPGSFRGHKLDTCDSRTLCLPSGAICTPFVNRACLIFRTLSSPPCCAWSLFYQKNGQSPCEQD